MNQAETNKTVNDLASLIISDVTVLVRKCVPKSEDPLIVASVILQALNTAATAFTEAIFEQLGEEDVNQSETRPNT